jgi:hypothetical protein
LRTTRGSRTPSKRRQPEGERSSSAPEPSRARPASLRQAHLFQERGVAGILLDVLEQRIDLDAGQSGVALRVGAVQPRKGIVGFAAKSIDFSDLERRVVLKSLDVICQRIVCVAPPAEGLVRDRKALARPHRFRLEM